jgi:flavin reductase (DIM6/NTAB) family NADH-FMN oxidoreductase RutF
MELKPFIGGHILPMPVVLVTTLSGNGIANAAPWGNISPVLRSPDEIMPASALKRDTLDNIRETGEFVVNITTVSMIDEVMVCSRCYPPETDEFDKSGLLKRFSKTVTLPGIIGSAGWIECTLEEEILREKFSIIVGKVYHIEMNDEFVSADGDLDYDKAEPLRMLCGNDKIHYLKPVCGGRTASDSEMFCWQEIDLF